MQKNAEIYLKIFQVIMLLVVILYGLSCLINLFIDKLLHIIFTLGVMAIAQSLDRILKIDLNTCIKTATITIIFLTLFLGETMDFYRILKYWDKIIHFSAGALFYWYFVILYANSFTNYRAYVIGIIFVMGLSTAWELVEYALDKFLLTNMQSAKLIYQNGLNDTMCDVIAGTTGGSVACIFHVIYLKVLSITKLPNNGILNKFKTLLEYNRQNKNLTNP